MCFPTTAKWVMVIYIMMVLKAWDMVKKLDICFALVLAAMEVLIQSRTELQERLIKLWTDFAKYR